MLFMYKDRRKNQIGLQFKIVLNMDCLYISSHGLTKNAIHTIFLYGKVLVILFSRSSIRTEKRMKGL